MNHTLLAELAPNDQALLDPLVAALRGAAFQHAGRAPNPAALPGVLVATPAALVDRAAEQLLVTCCGEAWARGWLPAELLHQARRGVPAAVTRLVATAIANDHVARRSVTLHPGWVDHVEALDLPPAAGRAGWVTQWAAATQPDRARAVATIVTALARMVGLPMLDPLLPPPGATGPLPAASWYLLDAEHGSTGAPILQRIRALLAKAESTSFEAESLAFTAKAQELMTKHAIDTALVTARPRGDRPVVTRLCIDAPYVDVKATLLHVVAGASRCRVIQHPSVALCTVVGFPADVHAVEVLYTSLLLQAQAALDDALRRSRRTGRVFRASFLAAYAHRISARLDAINQEVLAEAAAEHGTSIAPVLASRASEVDSLVDERFTDLRTVRSRRSYDAAGYASGRLAAERAQLTSGEVG